MDTFLSIATMAGGLAFFLFGMHLLGVNLERIAGGKMEKTLERLTDNVFKSLLLGIVVTAAIQSSSATTVIVVGLVNAGVLKLRNAIGVIMGANIGTTVTSLILSLADLDQSQSAGTILTLLKPTTLTPLIAVAGIIILMASRQNKHKDIGSILLGFGVLFNGMFIMTDAVEPLADSPFFQQLFSTLSNPFLGVLAGLVVTAIIQSSSASVGILQAVASTGAVTFSAAVPIILGQNIGTCVTSLISAVGANKNAKRAAMVHLYFNIIGTVLFFLAIYLIQFTIGFAFWEDSITMGGISAVHIIFNVVTTAVLLPFYRLLEKLACFTIREKRGEEDEEGEPEVAVLEERLLRTPQLALSQCHEAIQTMGEYARKNFERSIRMFSQFDPKRKEKIMEYENAIDRMEDRLNNYLIALTNNELTEEESREITYQLKLVLEFERVGDYAVNVLELAQNLHEKQAKLSPQAISELQAISDAVDEIIRITLEAFSADDPARAIYVEPLEETIDTMEDTLKFRHVDRLKSGTCTLEGGLVFLELLTNLERISDHCSNIAVYIIGYHNKKDSLDRHEYLKRVHDGREEGYSRMFQEYRSRYFSRIDKN